MRWLDLPGDPREHYLPRMEWTPDGSQLLVQQFNRLQNTNRVMLADPEDRRDAIPFSPRPMPRGWRTKIPCAG